MSIKKKLIVVGGPTASGKTALAIELAQQFGTEIVSADSRQFYKEMSIGTAKPTPHELAQAKHHFIDNLSIHDSYSVGDFERDALAVLKTIFEKNDTAIMVGGTGLYIRAVCEGLDEFPDVPSVSDKNLKLFLKKKVLNRFKNCWKKLIINTLQKLIFIILSALFALCRFGK